jgi:hypothetical protein
MRSLVLVPVILALAAPTAMAARVRVAKHPHGSYSGLSNQNGDGSATGIKIGGKYHLKGSKTGLFVKDFYSQFGFRCDNKQEGAEPGSKLDVTESAAFDVMKKRPIVYDRKKNYFEVVLNRATPVHGHLGGPPFGNANYGMGTLHMAIVWARDAKSAGARMSVTAEGGAPPLGTLVGTETLANCKTGVYDWIATLGDFI